VIVGKPARHGQGLRERPAPLGVDPLPSTAYRPDVDPTRRRVIAARTIAVVADAVQLGLLPVFAEGAASVANDILDVVVAAVMVALVGWHLAFAPAFLAELIPIVDLAPTWTIAVLIATRKAGTTSPPSAAGAEPRPSGPRDPGRLPSG